LQLVNSNGLQRRDKLIVLGIVVAQFLIGMGPVWARPFDWDATILWSYASIPFVVAGALWLRRGWGVRAWALDTIEVTAMKFAFTAAFLLAWLLIGEVGGRPLAPPPSPVAVEQAPVPRAPRPPDTRPRAKRTASITGVALLPDGRPMAQALVYVSRGVESSSFEVAPPAVVENDGRAFAPRALGVQVGQAVRLHSLDGQLHTLLAKKTGGTWVRNAPIPGGGERELVFDEPVGLATLECRVHPDEARGRVVILDHPLWTVADGNGRFEITGVPPGDGELTAVSEDLAQVRAAYHADDGQAAALTLR
jgi:plastocyanin